MSLQMTAGVATYRVYVTATATPFADLTVTALILPTEARAVGRLVLWVARDIVPLGDVRDVLRELDTALAEALGSREPIPLGAAATAAQAEAVAAALRAVGFIVHRYEVDGDAWAALRRYIIAGLLALEEGNYREVFQAYLV